MLHIQINYVEGEYMNTERLQNYFNKYMKSPKIHEAILYVEDSRGDFSWSMNYGEKTLDTPMIAASITKLFTMTCILVLYEARKLKLTDKIVDYLGEETIKGIHTYRGTDYSYTLTINNLLHQDSGLPDFYLAGKGALYDKVVKTDFSYSFDETITWTKSLPARFQPSPSKRAYYSDVNFDLLGKIIEKVTGLSYAQACRKYIIEKLSLSHTFIASNESEDIPHSYYKDQVIKRNKLISSCYASGGLITTARELMIFLKAFWSGQLFNKGLFHQISESKRLQLMYYPIQYAGGYMKIEAGLPLSKKSVLVGHSGSTGSFAFYCIDKDLFFVGDIPQMSNPSIGIRFIINAVLKLDTKEHR